jgi:hypothetical protein
MSTEQGRDAGIQPEDPLARFIYSKSHFSRDNNRVKYNAFMPGPDSKTSVFRTKDLNEAATWAIGEEVAQKRTQTLRGRGDIVAADVYKAKLTLVPSPPPRHANIDNWPAEKDAQMLRAIELADAAKLVTKPAETPPNSSNPPASR